MALEPYRAHIDWEVLSGSVAAFKVFTVGAYLVNFCGSWLIPSILFLANVAVVNQLRA